MNDAQSNIFCKNGGVNGVLFYTQQDRRHLVRNNIFYPPGENLVSSEENAYRAIGKQMGHGVNSWHLTTIGGGASLSGVIARPIRVEYAGAVYHVTARGNEREPQLRTA